MDVLAPGSVSVSIIDAASRSVTAAAGFSGNITFNSSHVRTFGGIQGGTVKGAEPEDLAAFEYGGAPYLANANDNDNAIANEVPGTTTLYSISAAPEPGTYALLLAGVGVVGWLARRRRG